MEVQPTPAPQHKKLTLILSVVATIVTIGGFALYYYSKYDTLNQQNLQSFIQNFGIFAPLFYGLLYIVGSPIPYFSTLMSTTGGLLFGALWGTVYTVAFATVSTLVPFTLSRQMGREWVEQKLEGKKIGDLYKQTEGSNGFMMVLLMRLIPVLPWEVQNYVLGLTKVKVPTMILATSMGIIPGSFSLVFLGDSLGGEDKGGRLVFAIALNVFMIVLPGIAIFLRNRNKKREQAPTMDKE